jgi:hypothetical protein
MYDSFFCSTEHSRSIYGDGAVSSDNTSDAQCYKFQGGRYSEGFMLKTLKTNALITDNVKVCGNAVCGNGVLADPFIYI